MKKSEKYKGKTAVVTGGSSGIGRVIIDYLSDCGFKVICVSRTSPDEKANCDFIECDLSIAEQAEETAKRISEKYPNIDLLINNAGLGISGATELLPMEKIRYVTEVDYFAPLVFTRALLPFMKEKSKIVMISSACALFALPFRGVYCSAKAALNMLSFSLRMELKPNKIDVVCICPGDIKSNFTENRIKDTATNIRYGERVINAQQKVDCRENKRMNLYKTGKKIAKIAVKKKAPLYIVGAKYKLLYFLSKIFPQRVMLKATGKMFGGK